MVLVYSRRSQLAGGTSDTARASVTSFPEGDVTGQRQMDTAIHTAQPLRTHRWYSDKDCMEDILEPLTVCRLCVRYIIILNKSLSGQIDAFYFL